MGSVGGFCGQGDSGIVEWRRVSQGDSPLALSTAWPYTSLMINNLTNAQQFEIIAQTFLKIAINFWPALLMIAIGMSFLAYTESRSK